MIAPAYQLLSTQLTIAGSIALSLRDQGNLHVWWKIANSPEFGNTELNVGMRHVEGFTQAD